MLASIILTSILHFYFADSFRQDTGIKVYEQTKQPARRVVAEALVQAPVEEVRISAKKTYLALFT